MNIDRPRRPPTTIRKNIDSTNREAKLRHWKRYWHYKNKTSWRNGKMPSKRNSWLQKLRNGDKVWCCYDGKTGRAQLGIVTRIRKRIFVTFIGWADRRKRRVRMELDKEGCGHNQSSSSLGILASLGYEHGDFYRCWPYDSKYILELKALPPSNNSINVAQVLSLLLGSNT
jgi:hypothetical protein